MQRETILIALGRNLLATHRRVALAICAVAAIGIATVAYAANGSVAYTYDALGRITVARYDTGACIFYSYDAAGNRLSQTIYVQAAGTTGVWGCFNWNNNGSALWGH